MGSIATGYTNGEGQLDVQVREIGVYSVRAELLGGFLSTAVGPFLVAMDRLDGEHVLPVRILLNINNDLQVDSMPHQSLVGLEGRLAVPMAQRDLDDVREIVLRHMLSVYDGMAGEDDAVPWEGYCVGFDGGRRDPDKRAPGSFIRRFGDHPKVHNLDWCSGQNGRVLSVGPIEWSSADLALVWSASSYGVNVRSGMYCLNKVVRGPDGWRREDVCLVGMRYN